MLSIHLVSLNKFTGGCARITQAAKEQSACLPIAMVITEGASGKLNTETALYRPSGLFCLSFFEKL